MEAVGKGSDVVYTTLQLPLSLVPIGEEGCPGLRANTEVDTHPPSPGIKPMSCLGSHTRHPTS